MHMKALLEALRASIKAESDATASGKPELFGSIFFCGISIILTILNVVKHVGISMTTATTVLAFGFAISSFLAYKKEISASKTVILILCGAIFSMFAVIGGNEGFAILWILLVPIIGPLWVGLKYGTILSAYFQVFLVVLLYTPLSKLVEGYYSDTFMLRFPLLYLATFGSITFLMWQRENLFKKLHKESYYDAMTGLKNRRCYIEQSETIRAKDMDPDFTCFSFDLNRLKYANDTYGHQAGDEILIAAAAMIKKNFRNSECFRTGGDEFMVFADGIDADKAIAGLKKDASQWKGKYMPNISISVGYAKASEEPGMSFDELVTMSDARMYEEKNKYYDENGFQKR